MEKLSEAVADCKVVVLRKRTGLCGREQPEEVVAARTGCVE